MVLNRFVTLLLLAAMCCIKAVSASHYGEQIRIDGVIYYVTSDSTCAVFRYSSWTGGPHMEFLSHVSQTYGGEGEITYTVNEIYSYAFNHLSNADTVTIPATVKIIRYCAFNNCSMKSVYILSDETEVQNNAFNQCDYMTEPIITNKTFYFMPRKYSGEYEMPDTINTIAPYACAGCSSLLGVTLPDKMKSIGEQAFSSCSAMKYINVPDGTAIGKNAFVYCNNLSEPVCVDDTLVHMPLSYQGAYSIKEGVTYIPCGFFSGCNGLTEIEIPGSVKIIGAKAFQKCENLRKVTFNEGLDSIGNDAFDQCAALTEINMLPESLTKVGTNAFRSASLTEPLYSSTIFARLPRNYTDSIDLPQNISIICDGAFSYCTSIPSFICRGDLAVLGQRAFEYCGRLKSATFEGSIDSLANLAFYYCRELTEVKIAGDAEIKTTTNVTFSTCEKLGPIFTSNTFFYLPASFVGEYAIPNGITRIAQYAFYNCNSLQAITLPPSITSIGLYAFYGCTYLRTVYNATLLPLVPRGTNYGNVTENASSVITIYPYNIYNGNDEVQYTRDSDMVDAIGTEPNALVFTTYYSEDEIPVNYIVEGTARNIALTDAAPVYCPENVMVDSLTYMRNFKNDGWQALYVPFDMSYEEWAQHADVAEISGVHQFYDAEGALAETVIEFRRVTGGKIRPNTPYVIKPKQAGEIIFKCADKILAATVDGHVWCASTRMRFDLNGIYQSCGIEGNYAISGGVFKLATATSPKLQPMRFYLSAEDVDNGYGVGLSGANVRSAISFTVDGETTAIEGLYADSENKNVIYYDLSGRKIEHPAKGLFIVKGKKVIVK